MTGIKIRVDLARRPGLASVGCASRRENRVRKGASGVRSSRRSAANPR